MYEVHISNWVTGFICMGGIVWLSCIIGLLPFALAYFMLKIATWYI